ncbi:MAG TPA: hypothetical protein P5235_09210 [Saprospiraceae bacterium]|nr:hypothetical protein [Saprospiraceae bacterium]
MNKLLSIILAFLIFSLSIRDLFTYSYFVINQDFIVENFCINKDKPQLMCNGSCYLNKNLKDNQDTTDKIPNPIKEKKSTIEYLGIENLLWKTEIKIDDHSPILEKENFFSYNYLSEIFHPPKLV